MDLASSTYTQQPLALRGVLKSPKKETPSRAERRASYKERTTEERNSRKAARSNFTD